MHFGYFRGELEINGKSELIEIRPVLDCGLICGYPKLWHIAINGYFVEYFEFDGRVLKPMKGEISSENQLIGDLIANVYQ